MKYFQYNIFLYDIFQCNIFLYDKAGFQCIHLAAQTGMKSSLKYLLHDLNVHVDTPTKAGSSPLAVAAKVMHNLNVLVDTPTKLN